MFLLASAVERFGPVLLVLPLLLAARSVRRLADRPDAVALRRSARTALVGFVAGGIVLAAWITAAIAVGLHPASNPRSWIAALLIAGPFVGVVRFTLPGLLDVVRGTGHDAIEPSARGALAVTRVVLPARLLPLAAGAAAVVTVAAQPSVRVAGVLALALVAVVVAIDSGQRTRRAAGLPATLRWPTRSRLVAPLVLVFAAAGCGLAGTSASAVPAALVVAGHAGHTAHLMTAGAPNRDVSDLTAGPFVGAVSRFTLVADEARAALSSGAVVDAWTFGGTVPGTEIRVREGDDVEVRLVNRLDTESTTVHWHGIDVPNAMDGVAGVTQDAVAPGEEFVYRFRAEQPGTFWYHAHQTSSVQVGRGLFGAFVVEPRVGVPAQVDETVLIHDWSTDRGSGLAFGDADQLDPRRAAPGTTVRLRVVNTESFSQNLAVSGTPYRLVALDGYDLHEPGELTTQTVTVGGGGRADLAFRMPDGPVRLSATAAPQLGLVYSPDGTATVDAGPPGEALDITRYGTTAPTPFGPTTRFDRDYRMDISEGLGFSRGGLDYVYTINGDVFPNASMMTVTEGDLVRVRISNAGLSEHPMHLHGHHVLVLSRDGHAVTGSPVWLDTVLVRPGETWEVAFRADNPGIWMDHCHILFHAASGMMMHVQYDGVTSAFDAGSASGNVPE